MNLLAVTTSALANALANADPLHAKDVRKMQLHITVTVVLQPLQFAATRKQDVTEAQAPLSREAILQIRGLKLAPAREV